jgi:adenosylhomocysteine nucleosidase
LSRVGIVVSLPAEVSSLAVISARRSAEGAKSGVRVEIERAGIGRERSSAAAERLLDRGATVLLSWGVAGALDPRLPSGGLVVPSLVRGGDGRTYSVNRAWHDRVCARLAGIRFETGPVLESPRVITNVADKVTAFRETGAVAVDMESAGVMGAADRRGIPALVVRSIVDAAGEPLPELANEAVRMDGRVSIRGLCAGLVRRPWDLPVLIAAGFAYRRAVHMLSRAARSLGPDFACPP